MFIPNGFTQQEVLEKLEQVVRHLARSFVCGYFDINDIKQEARMEGLKALPRYDPGGSNEDGSPKRPLENFLYSHIKNRLINFVRDNFRRNDPPCPLCHAGRHNEHADGQICEKYRVWRTRNNAKANLMRPLDIDNIADEYEGNMRTESDVEESAKLSEATRLLDEHLPVEMRSDFMRLKAGEKITKSRRLKIEAKCREILKDFINEDRQTE